MKINISFKRDSSDGTAISSGINRIGSLARIISNKVKEKSTSDPNVGSGSYLPVRWIPTRSKIIRVGTFALIITVASVLIGNLIKHMITNRVIDR